MKRSNGITADCNNMISINHVQPGKNKKILLKATSGRGPKLAEWVKWLYAELIEEFDRYRKAGVKFSPKLLVQLGKDIIRLSVHPIFASGYLFKDKPIIDIVDYRWISRFMDANNVVARAQTGKLMVSAGRMDHIEKDIAYHLGVIGRKAIVCCTTEVLNFWMNAR